MANQVKRFRLTQSKEPFSSFASPVPKKERLSTILLPEKFRPLFKPARYKAAYGGRGGAKSHSFAQALLLSGIEKPQRILCAREVQRSIRDSVKRLLDDTILHYNMFDFYNSTESEIKGSNGTLILFAGLRQNADQIRSLEGVDKAWTEEANTVSRASLDTLIPTIRKPDSELWFSWNPRLPTDPVDAMFRKGAPPPKSIIIETSYKDNPWFPKVLRADMEWDRQRDPDKYAHVWLGAYQKNSEARVFRNWKVESFDTPPDARFYFGADWGYAQDPTVLIRCFIEGRTLYIDKEAYRIGCEIDATPALFDTVEGSRSWPIRADSARPETISFMQRHGFPRMERAMKGPKSVVEGVEFLKNYDIIIHPTCTHAIDEFSLYNYKTDKLTGDVLPVLEDKKNHIIDSARYALEKVRVESRIGVPEFNAPFVIDMDD